MEHDLFQGAKKMSMPLHLSVAVPVHNEEAVLPELLRRMRHVLDNIPGGPHEIIFIDDGSSDRTLEILGKAANTDARILIISFSRNFGHQAALTAALDHVSGDAVVLMDGDLQDSPEVIPIFLKYYDEGYDVVYATRKRRKEGWWLKLCYFLFYRFQAMLSETLASRCWRFWFDVTPRCRAVAAYAGASPLFARPAKLGRFSPNRYSC